MKNITRLVILLCIVCFAVLTYINIVDRPVAVNEPVEASAVPTMNVTMCYPKCNVGDAPLYMTQYIRLGEYQIYGYDPHCAHCCGKTDGITASGVEAIIGRTVAMSKDIPFGTEVYIVGLGHYVVEDRGVGPGIVDVACENHAACYAITGRYVVYIVKAAVHE